MTTQFLTIRQKVTGFYKEKGSKFFAFAYPVAGLESIEAHLKALQKEHHQARHHCYAYCLGPKGSEYRVHDAGEPKHSAGDPILGQIKSFEITNVLVVVIRYFGGTKLGVGGLIQAYKESARLALDKAEIMVKELHETWVLSFAYPDMNAVMRVVKECQLTVISQELEECCIMELEVPLSKTNVVGEMLGRLHRVTQIVK